MSPRLVLLNLALLGVAGYFGLQLATELQPPRPLSGRTPALPAGAAASGAAAPAEPPTRPAPQAAYGVVAARNLFSPSRTDVVVTTPEAGAAPALPRPILHGVVLDDAKSRAYLEDVTTKRIFGYAVGDTVAGGKLTAIRGDRVVLARPEGSIEVLLRDPTKPAPPAVASGAQPGLQPSPQPGLQPGVRPPIRPGLSPSTPGVPATVVPGAPRPLQSIPSDFLRRPTVVPPEVSGG